MACALPKKKVRASFVKQSLERLYNTLARRLFQIFVYTHVSDQTPAASVISYCAYTTFPSTQQLSFAPNAPTTAACCQASRYWKTPLAMALSTCTYRHFCITWRMADLRQRRMASRAGDCADEAARCMSPCVPVAYNTTKQLKGEIEG